MEKYGLDQVFIADAGDGPSETQFTSFTRQCAQQLESIMPDNANIGVMSGKTISAVAKQFPSARKKHLHFIPLVGAMGNSGNDWNANSIARILAFKTDSSYSVLNAPVLTQSQKARDYFIQEPDIASVLKEGHKISRISTDIYKCRNIPHQTTLYEDFFHFLYNWGNTNQLIIRSNILLA